VPGTSRASGPTAPSMPGRGVPTSSASAAVCTGVERPAARCRCQERYSLSRAPSRPFTGRCRAASLLAPSEPHDVGVNNFFVNYNQIRLARSPQYRTEIPYDERLGPRAPRGTEQCPQRRARLCNPARPVVVQHGAGVADREHVAHRWTPYAPQRVRGSACLHGPACAVVVRDQADVRDREHLDRGPPPRHGRVRSPARAIVVQDRPGPDREHVAPRGAPDPGEIHRRPAGLRGPARSVVVLDRPAIPDGEDIASRAAPHSVEKAGRPARLYGPARAVEVEHRAAIADREQVARRAEPDAVERIRRPPRLLGPPGAVVVPDGPDFATREHIPPRTA